MSFQFCPMVSCLSSVAANLERVRNLGSRPGSGWHRFHWRHTSTWTIWTIHGHCPANYLPVINFFKAAYSAICSTMLLSFFLACIGPKSLMFLVIGLPKVQFPTAYSFNNNARAPWAIRSYIDGLLQAGYQTCAPHTMITFWSGVIGICFTLRCRT